jgi:dynein intermediate chain
VVSVPGEQPIRCRGIAKMGQRVVMGGVDGKLYIYDIGDMAIPRESEWTDMQKAISGVTGGGYVNGTAEGETARIVAGR